MHPGTALQILPSGLEVPPLPYLAVLVAVAVLVVAPLYTLETPVTKRTLLAFCPWIVTGGALHALYQLPGFETEFPLLSPLLAAPAVYATAFDLMGAFWVVGVLWATVNDRPESAARILGGVGVGIMLTVAGIQLWQASGFVDSVVPLFWPAIGVIVGVVVAAPLYWGLAIVKSDAVAHASWGGFLTVLAHALDGISTAIGVDVLGTGERTPIPRMIMDFAGSLPTAAYIGRGWLFVLVKLVVAVAIVVLLADYVDENETEGNLLFAVVIAVGLGPAMNNLFLFAAKPI